MSKIIKTVSVVIPCFNEEERIIPVLKEVLSSDVVKEVIVVDDGSLEKTVQVLKKFESDILIVRHPVNQGKAETMKTGLLKATGEVVAFIDADLHGFTSKHLEMLCVPVIKDDSDMVIGVREFDVLYARLFNFSVAYAGERAFKRTDLLKNIELFSSGGYAIEAAFNKFYFRNRRVTKVFLTGVGQTAKFKKTGISGLLGSFRMLKRIVSFTGWKEYIYQLSTVGSIKFYDEFKKPS